MSLKRSDLSKMEYPLTYNLEATEKQIIDRKEQLNLTKSKIESLKESIIEELQQLFPQYIDIRLISIVEHNADTIYEIPEEKFDKFKKDVLVAKVNAIKRVIDELSKAQDWLSCEKSGIGVGGRLWQIIKSIEKEFLPIFSEFNLKGKGASIFGSSDLRPISLDDFHSDELIQLNGELTRVLEDFCGKEDSLKELQNSITKKKALERWTSP